MKCFVLLTFATLCYSYPYGSGYGYGSGSGGNINIDQYGSVSITAANGRRLTVSRSPQQNGAIASYGNERYNRNYWYQPSQADALIGIVAQYQGDVNQNSFQQLLGDVRAAVQAGQLSNNVYQVLQNLNQAQNQAGERQRIQVRFSSNAFQNQAGQSGVQERLQELRQAQQIQQLIQQEQQVQQLLQQQQQQFQRNQYVQFGVQGQADAYLGAENQGVYGQQRIGRDVGVARSWSTFITDILNGNRQQNVGQYNRYGQQIGQSVSNQFSQIAEEERYTFIVYRINFNCLKHLVLIFIFIFFFRKILVQQDEIQQQQLQQKQQQQQLLEQQLEQLQQKQQQQDIEEFQQQVQQEQEVLNQQQRLQQEQEQQQQQLQQQLQQQQRQRPQLQQQQLQQEQQLRNLLNGARVFIVNKGSSFWQQQPGVYPRRGQYGGEFYSRYKLCNEVVSCYL